MFKIGGKAVSEELEKLRYKQDAAERKLTKLRTKTVSEQDKSVVEIRRLFVTRK